MFFTLSGSFGVFHATSATTAGSQVLGRAAKPRYGSERRIVVQKLWVEEVDRGGMPAGYNGTMTDYIDPGQLRPGPIRHASLPPELLEPIRAVYEIVGPYLDTTLEQFEVNFMRDMHPDEEVAGAASPARFSRSARSIRTATCQSRSCSVL